VKRIRIKVLAMGKQADRQLRGLLKQGGEFTPDLAQALEQAATEQEWAWLWADCSRARNRSALFRAVVKAVDYPQFFGGSFEGLYDCLCESILDQKSGLVLVFKDLHSADPDLERDMPQLMQTLEDVVQSVAKSDRVFAYCLEHGGKHDDDAPGTVRNWSEE
jgi:RNAse (barnase) inhibitor barstar